MLRRREADELAKEKRFSMVKCGICKAIGHNKRSCLKAPANLKRKRTGEVFKKKKLSFVLIEFVFYFFHYHQTYYFIYYHMFCCCVLFYLLD